MNELDEKVWQLLAYCVMDCRDAESSSEEDRVISAYVPRVLALIAEQRSAAAQQQLEELYALPPELSSPVWRRLRVQLAQLRAQR